MLKVAIMGNSVSLLMRPPRQGPDERTYAEILEQELPARVTQWSQRASMVRDAVRAVEDAIIPIYPDVVVLQYGIVECTYREIPRWLYQFTKLRLQGDEGALERLPVQLAARLLVPLFRGWTRATGRRRWMEPRVFLADLTKLIRLLRKETSAQVLLLNIPEPSQRVEALAPGTQRSAAEYNRALERLAQAEGVTLIDARALAAEDAAGLLPDGIHFSARGHRRIAALLSQALSI